VVFSRFLYTSYSQILALGQCKIAFGLLIFLQLFMVDITDGMILWYLHHMDWILLFCLDVMAYYFFLLALQGNWENLSQHTFFFLYTKLIPLTPHCQDGSQAISSLYTIIAPKPNPNAPCTLMLILHEANIMKK